MPPRRDIACHDRHLGRSASIRAPAATALVAMIKTSVNIPLTDDYEP